MCNVFIFSYFIGKLQSIRITGNGYRWISQMHHFTSGYRSFPYFVCVFAPATKKKKPKIEIKSKSQDTREFNVIYRRFRCRPNAPSIRTSKIEKRHVLLCLRRQCDSNGCTSFHINFGFRSLTADATKSRELFCWCCFWNARNNCRLLRFAYVTHYYSD